MPFIDPSCGCGWDPTSGPDVYFDLTDFGGTILASGNVFNDVTPANLPLTWVFSTPYQISNLNAIFKVQVYDSDAPLSPAFIGGYFITFSNYAPSYPTTITLQNSSSSLVEVLTVQWQ